ncbi:hypothetical protein DD237_008166 [Peronospora effusa]|uniref:Uncharacterized protein n=1 Tax=Peronospora effusa TaxID=542832 RepID=A0A425CPI8_9STRA|nr:hypothetical protein DD237_008166 [Peronospora effusa]
MSISLEEVIPFVCEVVANAQIIDLHTLMSLRDHGVAQQRAVYLPLPRGRVPADLEKQAGLIWKHLFVDRSPASDACRGVLTTATYWPKQPRVEASPSFYSRMAQALTRQTWRSVPTNGSSVRDDDQRSVSKLEEARLLLGDTATTTPLRA